jgi:chromate transporter
MNEIGSPFEVLRVFLRLGLTCFGGPIAHIGYFREEFVVKRRWLSDQTFADLLALCQFLPGPASSQLGFAIGLRRAGLIGALAAWCGFTLPSAAALILFALTAEHLQGHTADGVLHGLKLVAVAIVGQALWGMARSLCPDRTRAAIGLAALVIMLVGALPSLQITAILSGAAAGALFCRESAIAKPEISDLPTSRTIGLVAFLLFLLFLLGLPLLASERFFGIFNICYRAGAFVFGGGHVVLPLLRDAMMSPGVSPAMVSDDQFLAGYGAAQAVPGPLFTFAAYLGTIALGWRGGLVALIAIFLPGMLLLLAALPFWHRLRRLASAQAIMRGVNASVVGLLGAAFYDPIWVSSVGSKTDFAVAAVGFILLTLWRAPPLVVVILGAAAGVFDGF